ncbi:MAG: hypothetical protein IKE03_08340 [Blautia sp.]|nr:hypothetical protein [Blautia sp.]
MTRKEKLAARKALEDYYFSCPMETPEQVARQFEVYTKLIWDYHQAGLCYDYYCDSTVTRLEGTGRWVGGHDALEVETLPTFSPYPRDTIDFRQIYAVGDPEHGYHFGQVTTSYGAYAKEGASVYGCGDDSSIGPDQMYGLCECAVNKVDGRWCITDEWFVTGQEVNRKRTAGSRPFCKTILDAYPQTPPVK